MIRCFILLISFSIFHNLNAQILKKVSNAAKARVGQKAVEKTGNAVNKVIHENLFNKDTVSPEAAGNNTTSHNASVSATETKPASGTNFSVYSKFDFVPGEKVMVFEDFSQEAIGDFPANWNTNASGEIVTVDGYSGKWLMINSTGVYMPENIKHLPENFTLEFDLMCNPTFRYTSSPFSFALASLKSPQEYVVWEQGTGGRKGFLTWVIPNSPSGKSGKAGYNYYNDNGEDEGQRETSRFHGLTKNNVKVSIWRQKSRVRVYLDEEKIVDVARGLNSGDYNAFVLSLSTAKTAPDQYLISNIRLAVGAPDTRNKLLEEGNFVTTGILFEVNSAEILPSSYGVLKEIAETLRSDPSVRIRIIGHTDSDGDATANKELSERRAAAVKKALGMEFNIAPERMEISGKGEGNPISDNKTSEGKFQNRRVEFMRL